VRLLLAFVEWDSPDEPVQSLEWSTTALWFSRFKQLLDFAAEKVNGFAGH